MRRLVAAGAALLALALAAAGALAGRPATQTVSVPESGFSIALPSTWHVVRKGLQLDKAVAAKLPQDNPALAQALAQAASPGNGARLFAADPVAHDGFNANVNVIVAAIPAGITPGAYRSALVAEIKTLAPLGLRVTTDRLPAGDAVHARYVLRTRRGNGVLAVALEQFGFLSGKRSVVVTFSLPQTLAAAARPAIGSALASFRLIDTPAAG